MISRRLFLLQVAGGAGAVHQGSALRDTGNLFVMDQGAARQVTLPPKPNAVRQLSDQQRDDLEHRIRCQCGCTLDVFTCRTTDFSCRVSPAMHRDIDDLVKGGYSAQEIIDAFVNVYGERALMAPKKSGFNLLAWMTPSIAVAVAGVLIYGFLRSLRRPPGPLPVGVAPRIDATPDELARVEAAVKGEGDS